MSKRCDHTANTALCGRFQQPSAFNLVRRVPLPASIYNATAVYKNLLRLLTFPFRHPVVLVGIWYWNIDLDKLINLDKLADRPDFERHVEA